jgi:hypothetical protein
MRQIFLTKEHLIRYLDLLDPSSRIEFDIRHEGKVDHVDHIRGFSRMTDPLDGEMVCTLHLEDLEELSCVRRRERPSFCHSRSTEEL